MREIINRLHSLLFSEDGHAINPQAKKYLVKMLRKNPGAIDWEILDLGNLTGEKRLIGACALIYDIVRKKLESHPNDAPREKKLTDRLLNMLDAPQKDDTIYAYFWKIFLGYNQELIRKLDPYKRFYHKIQQKIARMKPDSGIFPFELNKGQGKRHYSNNPEPDRKNVYDADNPEFYSLRLPDLPLKFFSAEFYAHKQIRSSSLAPMASFFCDEITFTCPRFEGRPCYICIEAFARWLARNFPDLEGELRHKDSLDENLAISVAADFNLEEENELKLFDDYASRMWSLIPEKYRSVLLIILQNWLANDEGASDSAMAESIGHSPQLFKYKKDRLIGADNDSVGLLRKLWTPCLNEFLKTVGESRLPAFLVHLYEYCRSQGMASLCARIKQ